MKSEVAKLRAKWLKKGYELINITNLCTAKIGGSGWCEGIFEPDEEVFHIKIIYREEEIAIINTGKSYVIEDKKYLLWHTNDDDITGSDFIIFRKVKL